MVYTHTGILLSHKKEWNVICSNIAGPTDYHSKWSKRKTYHMVLLICGILKNNGADEHVYKTESQI